MSEIQNEGGLDQSQAERMISAGIAGQLGGSDNHDAETSDDSSLDSQAEDMVAEGLERATTPEDDDSANEEAETEETEESHEDDAEEGDDDETLEEDDEGEDESEGQFDSDYQYFDEEEGREVFLKAVDPESGEKSIYLDRKSAQEGLQRQVQYIGKLKSELAETKERYENEVVATQQELEMYRKNTDKEAARDMLIRDKLPEKFQTVNPDEISDENEYREYVRAKIAAEEEVEREVARQKADARDRKAKDKEAREAAESHVASRSQDWKFLGVVNPEDKAAVSELLSSEKDGVKIRNMIVDVTKAYGQDVGDKLLKGLVADLTLQRQTQTVQKAKNVVEGKKKVKTKKRTSSPATAPQRPSDARSMITTGLTQQGKTK